MPAGHGAEQALGPRAPLAFGLAGNTPSISPAALTRQRAGSAAFRRSACPDMPRRSRRPQTEWRPGSKSNARATGLRLRQGQGDMAKRISSTRWATVATLHNTRDGAVAARIT